MTEVSRINQELSNNGLLFEARKTNTIVTVNLFNNEIKRGVRFDHKGKKNGFERDCYDFDCWAAENNFLEDNRLYSPDTLELIDGFADQHAAETKQLEGLKKEGLVDASGLQITEKGYKKYKKERRKERKILSKDTRGYMRLPGAGFFSRVFKREKTEFGGLLDKLGVEKKPHKGRLFALFGVGAMAGAAMTAAIGSASPSHAETNHISRNNESNNSTPPMYSEAPQEVLSIHHIDVGYGEATVIKNAEGKTLLISTGKNSKAAANATASYIKDVLKQDYVNYILIPSYSAEHVGGYKYLVNDEGIKIINGTLDRGGNESEYNSQTYQDYLPIVVNRTQVYVGYKIDLGGGTDIEVLACGDVNTNTNLGETVKGEDDECISTKVSQKDFNYFSGGNRGTNDSSGKDLESILAPKIGEVEAMKTSNHGDEKSSNDVFVNTTKPQVSVIPNGKNSNKDPAESVVNKLDKVGDVFITENETGVVVNGNVVIRVFNDDSYCVVPEFGNTVYYQCKNNSTPSNHPPRFTNLPDKIYAKIGEETQYDVDAEDADGDTLEYSEDTNLFEIDRATGVFSYTPSQADVGEHNITFKVIDGNGGEDTKLVDLVVSENTESGENHPPVLDKIKSPLRAKLDKPLSVDFNTKDADNDKITYSVNSSLGNLNPDTGLLQYTPKAGDEGIYKIKVVASDGKSYDSQTLDLEVGLLELIHINVGAGDSTLIISPSDQRLLIDTDGGSQQGIDAVYKEIQDKLADKKLDYVLITHYHQDHVGGYAKIVGQGVSVGETIDTDGGTDAVNSIIYRDYCDKAISRTTATLNGTLDLGGGITARILAVGDRANKESDTIGGSVPVGKENDYSIALKINYNNFQYLTAGDLSEKVENLIGPLVGVIEACKISHHGSGTSSNESYLKTIGPEAAVISCGKGSDSDAAANRLTKAGIDVYKTSNNDGSISNGTVTLKVFPDGRFIVDSEVGQQKEYQSQNSNNPPSFTNLPEKINATAGKQFYLDVNALDIDGDKLVFSADTDLFNVDPNTGVIKWTPSEKDVGEYNLRFMVSDEKGGEDSKLVKLVVNKAVEVVRENHIPRFVDFPESLEVKVGEKFYMELRGKDDDGDKINYSANTQLFKIDRDKGIVDWIPKASDVGKYYINFSIDDGKSSNTKTLELIVKNTETTPMKEQKPVTRETEETTGTPEWVYVAVGCIAGAAAAIGTSLYFYMRKRKKKEVQVEEQLTPLTPNAQSLPFAPNFERYLRQYGDLQIQISDPNMDVSKPRVDGAVRTNYSLFSGGQQIGVYTIESIGDRVIKQHYLGKIPGYTNQFIPDGIVGLDNSIDCDLRFISENVVSAANIEKSRIKRKDGHKIPFP